MLEAFLYGTVASSALLMGSMLALVWRTSRQTTGIVLAFASGTLISALAFELFPVAVRQGGMVQASLGLTLGAASFAIINWWLDRRLVPQTDEARKSDQSNRSERAFSLALLASVTLDGIPENLAMGAEIEAGASLALPFAIFASNFPEALIGAAFMQRSGQSRGMTIAIWSGATVVLAAMSVAGYAASGALSHDGRAWLLSFAGGAVLASLADTLMPEAFERGQPWNSLATAAGFVASFAIANG
jgi:ZIP family zinc transporter